MSGMRLIRNPFTLRIAEHIESDDTFLRLFGPGVLDLLQKEEIWHRVQFFQSSPGGGKTSLFRLFTPTCLLTLYDSRASGEVYEEIYKKLKALEVLNEEGPNVVGIMLSNAYKDADIEYLRFDEAQKKRLFFSLLNSRITIGALRSALELKKLTFPDDLSKIYIKRPHILEFPNSIPVPCTGDVLYNWASKLELDACKCMDSFGPTEDSFTGFDTIYCLYLLQPGCIRFNDKPIAARSLLMLDNLHRLASTQRKNLLDALFNLRVPVGVWLAERLEVLTPVELFGATLDREYSEPVRIEEYWKKDGNYRKYEQLISSIADRRAQLNPEVQINSFSTCLKKTLDGPEWQDKYSKAIVIMSKRIEEKTKGTKQYDKWLSKCKSASGTKREQALNWKILEIKIERNKRKAQKQLLDAPLPEEELDVKIEASTKEAAELFLAHEFHFPYYFGFSELAKMSSSNITQFLTIANDLFEEVISARLLRQSIYLTPDRQEDILTKVATRRWNSIPFSDPNGRDIVRLLEAIRLMCQTETEKPNAPYAPGVTGFAISMHDKARLTDINSLKNHPEYAHLSKILSACIANNYLEVYLDRRQGPKEGKTWMILYLNRILCLHFGLPINYGGWRAMKLDELCKYVSQRELQKVKARKELVKKL